MAQAITLRTNGLVGEQNSFIGSTSELVLARAQRPRRRRRRGRAGTGWRRSSSAEPARHASACPAARRRVHLLGIARAAPALPGSACSAKRALLSVYSCPQHTRVSAGSAASARSEANISAARALEQPPAAQAEQRVAAEQHAARRRSSRRCGRACGPASSITRAAAVAERHLSPSSHRQVERRQPVRVGRGADHPGADSGRGSSSVPAIWSPWWWVSRIRSSRPPAASIGGGHRVRLGGIDDGGGAGGGVAQQPGVVVAQDGDGLGGDHAASVAVRRRSAIERRHGAKCPRSPFVL